ncbi:MAG: SUMF1/EgtB/PvdO family nonheme iron enzyme [Chloroflexi bacterium]|nr:SUMF1/EgtB/PvdO family nonheme iron enzyme [Chloroflexota bacterium]
MSRPLRVFLCHASQDKPAVWRLHRYLKQHGVQPWLDQVDLLPGQNWEVEIPNALAASDVILVCLSKNSVDKEGYVQKEISFALDKALEKPEGTIFVIPVKLEECDIPKRLSRYQWVDLSRADGRKRLLMGLNKRASDLGAEVSPVVLEDVRQRKTAPRPAASDIAESEKAEQEAKETAEREATEKAARENAEREEKEKAEREAAEKAALEKAEREEKERTVRETAEKILREKNAREAAEKIKREQAVQSIPLGEKPSGKSAPAQISNRKPTKPKIPVWVMGLLALGLVSLSVWGMSRFITPFGIGSTMIGEDGMTLMYVPAGDFLMGSTDAASWASSDEKPQHTVTLDAFWIDQTEVTNKMYSLCVSAGVCNEPSNNSSSTRSSYYGNSEFDDYPVLYVDWNMARTYCQWAGRDLPTEAQWEKAARGTDGRIYPWGNDFDCHKGNFDDETQIDSYVVPGGENCDGFPETAPVGSFTSGQSPYGAYDMAGNVWEWVRDWYDETYYQNSPLANPFGPDSGQYRVLRGGSWNSINSNTRSAYRYRAGPANSYSNLGFRCSRSP